MITVGFENLEEFADELVDAVKQPAPNGVADNLVRWRVTRTPEQKEAISFQVDAWATAVISRPDADYLAEWSATVGRDTVHNDDAGSKSAANLKKQLASICSVTGSLRLLPGKIEVY